MGVGGKAFLGRTSGDTTLELDVRGEASREVGNERSGDEAFLVEAEERGESSIEEFLWLERDLVSLRGSGEGYNERKKKEKQSKPNLQEQDRFKVPLVQKERKSDTILEEEEESLVSCLETKVWSYHQNLRMSLF